MVTKNQTAGDKEESKDRVKIGKLEEATKELTAEELSEVKGGSTDDRTQDLRAIGEKVESNMRKKELIRKA